MTERNSATIDIDLGAIATDFAHPRHHHWGECLIDFYQVNVINRHPRFE